MKSESLQLKGTLDDGIIKNITHVLNAVNGVSKIAVTTANGNVNIDFDENITSAQELRTILKNAGVNVKSPAHGEEGSCCGSCGG